jgi:hypothetical protein
MALMSPPVAGMGIIAANSTKGADRSLRSAETTRMSLADASGTLLLTAGEPAKAISGSARSSTAAKSTNKKLLLESFAYIWEPPRRQSPIEEEGRQEASHRPAGIKS